MIWFNSTRFEMKLSSRLSATTLLWASRSSKTRIVERWESSQFSSVISDQNEIFFSEDDRDRISSLDFWIIEPRERAKTNKRAQIEWASAAEPQIIAEAGHHLSRLSTLCTSLQFLLVLWTCLGGNELCLRTVCVYWVSVTGAQPSHQSLSIKWLILVST